MPDKTETVEQIVYKHFPLSSGASIKWTPEDENRKQCIAAINEALAQQKAEHERLQSRLAEVMQWLPWIQSLLEECRDEFKVCEEDVCGHPSEQRFCSFKEQCSQAAIRMAALLKGDGK